MAMIFVVNMKPRSLEFILSLLDVQEMIMSYNKVAEVVPVLFYVHIDEQAMYPPPSNKCKNNNYNNKNSSAIICLQSNGDSCSLYCLWEGQCRIDVLFVLFVSFVSSLISDQLHLPLK